MAIAQNAARQAWRGGALSVDDETRLLDLFGRTFTSTDHDMRMDALLWADATSAAADRKSVGSGKSGSVRVERGGGRSIKKKTRITNENNKNTRRTMKYE